MKRASVPISAEKYYLITHYNLGDYHQKNDHIYVINYHLITTYLICSYRWSVLCSAISNDLDHGSPIIKFFPLLLLLNTDMDIYRTTDVFSKLYMVQSDGFQGFNFLHWVISCIIENVLISNINILWYLVWKTSSGKFQLKLTLLLRLTIASFLRGYIFAC